MVPPSVSTCTVATASWSATVMVSGSGTSRPVPASAVTLMVSSPSTRVSDLTVREKVRVTCRSPRGRVMGAPVKSVTAA